jgi:hypothetical protein
MVGKGSVLGVICAVLVLGATSAIAAPVADEDDSFTQVGTAFTATLAPGTNAMMIASEPGPARGFGELVITCTTLTFSGTTPETGLGPFDIGAAMFAGCTDNLGGTDRFRPSGRWKLSLGDNAHERKNGQDIETLGPNDTLSVHVPKRGEVINVDNGLCKLYLHAQRLTAYPYDDSTGTATFDGTYVSFTSRGPVDQCPQAGAGSLTASLVLSYKGQAAPVADTG